MPDLAVSGTTLHYEAAGDPASPPVILLHGAPRDWTTWRDLMPRFAERYRVYAIDARGFGASGRPGAYSYELMAEDVAAFAESLRISRFALIGHSMGATTAAIYAPRHPETLAALVLVDAVPPSEPLEMDLGPRPTEDPGFDFDALAAIYAQLAAPDPRWTQDLAAVAAPTLVLGGGAESPSDQAHLLAAATMIPGGRMQTIEGAGHRIQRTKPNEFMAAVLPFLAAQAEWSDR